MDKVKYVCSECGTEVSKEPVKDPRLACCDGVQDICAKCGCDLWTHQAKKVIVDE